MDESLPLSIVEHYAYCPRQAALIHVEGVWAANADTARGEADHASVDRGVRMESRDGVTTWLSLPVWSERLQVAGVCDAVELVDGAPTPVEHKPRFPGHLHAPAAQQLAAQAMCLEEMWGYPVTTGFVFARTDRRRHPVAIDSRLRAATEQSIEACHRILRERLLPPVVADARCPRCSLAEVCGVDLPRADANRAFRVSQEADW